MPAKQIFIVGMPRSGTKLLRALLNNHPKISILSIESEFLPYWDKNWVRWGGAESLSQYDSFFKFYKRVINLPYFIYKTNQNKLIGPDDWYHSCENYSVSGVFEALARHDANVDETMIWGDKSPGYIRHVPFIKKHFPEAKIIHIVRDVRDYCLSINKAWGKNMLRAAQRWADDVAKAQENGVEYGDDYFEIKYEDLLEAPEKKLENICSFLGIKYNPVMLQFDKPTENIGDAAGQIGIYKKNTQKFSTMMKPTLRRKIEQIAFPVLLDAGYESESFLQKKRLNLIEKKLYQLQDGLHLIRARNQHTDRGLLEAVNFYLKAFKQSKVKR